MIDWCEAQYWTVIKYSLSHTHFEKAGEVWSTCVDILYSLPNYRLPCLMNCLSLSLPSVSCPLSTLSTLSNVLYTQVAVGQVLLNVRWCWKCVKDCTFTVSSFLTVLLHPVLLSTTNPDVHLLIEEVGPLISLSL